LYPKDIGQSRRNYKGKTLARILVMPRPGAIAFPVIIALGAVTGFMTYNLFNAAMPQQNKITSPYYQPLAANTGNNSSSGSSAPAAAIDESKYTNKVEIKILQGASVQGSPAYGPDPATAGSDALVTWVNADTTLHTATSGKDQSDPDSAKLFDSKYLQPNAKYSVPASTIGKGQHPYYCQVHPYMKGTITIQ
jgi:plastocyanin